jgi:hypothetical protein
LKYQGAPVNCPIIQFWNPGTSNSRRDNIEVSLGGETQTDVAEVKLVGGFNPAKKIENM